MESVNIKADNVFDAVKSLLGVTITTGSGTVSVFADNVKIIIPDGTTRKISFFEKFFIETGGYNVTNIDTSMVFTSNMTDMNSMFSGCETLTSLDLSRFDTSNVTSMKDMFSGCSGLTSLDVSNFDTSNVTVIDSMFKGCTNLTQLSLGEGFFKTQSVSEVDFSDLGNWAQDSFLQSVVTNSYDRTSNGLPNITIKLHANTYAYLTDEHKASLTAKGYNVVSV